MKENGLFVSQYVLDLIDHLLYSDSGEKRDAVDNRNINIKRHLRRSNYKIGIRG